MSEIYMPLLDEGLPVWRPVPAYAIDGDIYIVLRPADYDALDEQWQFPPGSVVRTSERALSGGTVRAAMALASTDRQIA